jgi:hypothetical protein
VPLSKRCFVALVVPYEFHNSYAQKQEAREAFDNKINQSELSVRM